MQTYRKTEAGKLEIVSRSGQVSPRLRSLLVMIDGKRDTDELMKIWCALGYNTESLEELARLGMIEAANEERLFLPDPQENNDVAEIPVQINLAPIAEAPTTGREISDTQIVYAFYCDTVRDFIGMWRGFAFQLRVEKASTMDDFRALRNDYVKLVEKRLGPQTAQLISTQLDQLLTAT